MKSKVDMRIWRVGYTPKFDKKIPVGKGLISVKFAKIGGLAKLCPWQVNSVLQGQSFAKKQTCEVSQLKWIDGPDFVSIYWFWF